MYIYHRQCHRSLKPAAVFPIEVELGIDIDISRRYYHDEEETTKEEEYQDSNDNSNDNTSMAQEQSQLPPVDDLLLDLGLSDTQPPLMQTSGQEQ